MFCPKCRGEYREGFDTCADCHVALVSELPPLAEPRVKPDDSGLEFVHILSTYNASDIAIIRSYFDAERIRYFIEGETFNILRPLVQPARVLVVRDDLPAAQQIVADLELRHTTHLTLKETPDDQT